MKSIFQNTLAPIPNSIELLPNWYWVVCLSIILFQTFLWSYQGSGVSRIRFFYQYPEGYNYHIDDPVIGKHIIQKEDVRYITQYFNFLGDKNLKPYKNWSAQRNLYSLMVSGFWMFGFVIGGIVFNVLLWIASLVGAVWMMKLVCTGNSERFAAAISGLFVVFHQGFLWSVGETNPHMAGYATGFIILGAMSYWRLFERDVCYKKFLIVCIITSVLSMMYSSAFLYAPLLFFAVIRHYWDKKYKMAQLLISTASLVIITLAPYYLFKLALNEIGHFNLSIGTVYGNLFTSWFRRNGFQEITWQILNAMLGGFTAFEPFLLPLGICGMVHCLKAGKSLSKTLLFYFTTVMCLLTYPNLFGGVPGYGSYHMVPFMILFAAYFINNIMKNSSRIRKSAFIVFIVANAIYVNTPLFGSSLPLNLAFAGHRIFTDTTGKLFRSYVSYKEHQFY